MSNKRKTKRSKGEGSLGMSSGTGTYIDKVQYYKSMCAQVGYPWDEASQLFEEACKVWPLSLPVIVDKLAETVRQGHIALPGRNWRLEFKGTDLVLVPKEEEK